MIERFPEWSTRISLLTEQGEDFVELCSEYDELAEWLDTHRDISQTERSEWAANRLLLVEMEVEILRFLQALG